ncbi:unnamed protein product [Cuscuta campestris]|uniref:Retrotransposon Copia-like N-terminal domain-containing protein n=1 Tax=Cuscuta campestris TaxID=132261 RepID=A0A484N8X4_9ASTE|nr:unnamed protein product [Cuscuta campestris]
MVSELRNGLKLFIKNLHSLTPEKLDDSNFPAWVSTISANLLAHRLMGYVDGTIAAPPSTVSVTDKEGAVKFVPNPEYEIWSVIDAQLCACLLATISPSVQSYLQGQHSAATIWNHLQLRYNSLSRTHIFQLKEQLRSLHKGTDSMQKYLDAAVKIVADLKRAKSDISDQDIILCILRGLPSEYAAIKQNIRTNIGPSSTPPPHAFYASQSSAPNESWFLDTGANAHVTPDLSRLYSHTPYSGTKTVTSAGGHPLPIANVGSELQKHIWKHYKKY